jgi:hypothetical protein
LLGLSYGQAAGALNASFDPKYRYTGAALTSDVAWLIGAGFAPLVALGTSAYFGLGYVSLYLLSGARERSPRCGSIGSWRSETEVPRCRRPTRSLCTAGSRGSRSGARPTKRPIATPCSSHSLPARAILAAGGSALDAVVATVVSLEDCPLFNAGLGSAFTAEGTHELDAGVMDGSSLAAGAVAGVRTIRNPVLAALEVMREGRCVLLAADGAERLARERWSRDRRAVVLLYAAAPDAVASRACQGPRSRRG